MKPLYSHKAYVLSKMYISFVIGVLIALANSVTPASSEVVILAHSSLSEGEIPGNSYHYFTSSFSLLQKKNATLSIHSYGNHLAPTLLDDPDDAATIASLDEKVTVLSVLLGAATLMVVVMCGCTWCNSTGGKQIKTVIHEPVLPQAGRLGPTVSRITRSETIWCGRASWCCGSVVEQEDIILAEVESDLPEYTVNNSLQTPGLASVVSGTQPRRSVIDHPNENSSNTPAVEIARLVSSRLSQSDQNVDESRARDITETTCETNRSRSSLQVTALNPDSISARSDPPDYCTDVRQERNPQQQSSLIASGIRHAAFTSADGLVRFESPDGFNPFERSLQLCRTPQEGSRQQGVSNNSQPQIQLAISRDRHFQQLRSTQRADPFARVLGRTRSGRRVSPGGHPFATTGMPRTGAPVESLSCTRNEPGLSVGISDNALSETENNDGVTSTCDSTHECETELSQNRSINFASTKTSYKGCEGNTRNHAALAMSNSLRLQPITIRSPHQLRGTSRQSVGIAFPPGIVEAVSAQIANGRPVPSPRRSSGNQTLSLCDLSTNGKLFDQESHREQQAQL